MSKVIIGGGGAGGIDSDELTASTIDVLAGKKFGGVGSDEVQIGTMPSYGGTYWNRDMGVGLEPDNFYSFFPPGHYASFDSRGSLHRIPIAKVQGAIGATGGKIIKGQTICGVAGTVDVQSILAFNCAVYSSTAITFNWQNPAKGAFSGVIIVGKTGSYPTSIGDGTRYYQGFGNNSSANGWSSVVANNFVSGNTYYFRCFSYAIKGGAEWIHSNSLTANATTSKGQVILTSSGVWTVPDGVRSIDIFLVGGGGGGGTGEKKGASYPWYSGTGGAGGYTGTWKSIQVSPNTQFNCVVGIGGVAGSGVSARPGGNSAFGSMSVMGGSNEGSWKGNGGSGGGGSSEGSYGNGGSGGTDGADGQAGTNNGSPVGSGIPGGKGQKTTTRAFGEGGNILYSGGGGAGAGSANWYEESDGWPRNPNPGVGGAGGGGRGGGRGNDGKPNFPIAGQSNTGSGGGAGCAGYTNTNWESYTNGAIGGSGVCIIRWGY